jgi:hypothetical protein
MHFSHYLSKDFNCFRILFKPKSKVSLERATLLLPLYRSLWPARSYAFTFPVIEKNQGSSSSFCSQISDVNDTVKITTAQKSIGDWTQMKQNKQKGCLSAFELDIRFFLRLEAF